MKIGELVWYRPIANEGLIVNPVNGGEPLAAIVTGINEDQSVNVAVFDFKGQVSNRTNQRAIEAGSLPPARPYVEFFTQQSVAEEEVEKRGPGRPRKSA